MTAKPGDSVDFPISNEAEEAVRASLIGNFAGYPGKHYPPVARAAIQAFLEAEGFAVQKVEPGKLIKEWVGNGEIGARRLVSRWRPATLPDQHDLDDGGIDGLGP